MTDALRALLEHYRDLAASMAHQVELMRAGTIQVRENVGEGMADVTERTIREVEGRISDLNAIISSHEDR